jgi:hypothetical protein
MKKKKRKLKTTSSKRIPKRRVFILGAGMSNECGAPTLSQFLDPNFTVLAHKKDVKIVNDFIFNAYPRNARPNIEEILSLIDHSLSRKEPLMQYNLNDLRKIRSSTVNVITEILTETQEQLQHDLGLGRQDNPYGALNAKSPKEGRRIYENKQLAGLTREMNFYCEGKLPEECDKLSKSAQGWSDSYQRLASIVGPNDAIITTNYDLFFDFAIDSLWMKFGGLDDGSSIEIDYGVDYQNLSNDYNYNCNGPLDYRETGKISFENTSIPLIKLHGSFNWAFCNSCKTLIMTDSTPISRIQRYISSLQSMPEKLKRGYLCCPRFSLEPLIVPPSWMKDYDNPILGALWMEAMKRISFADELYFLGYSFSEADFQIRYLFTRALHLRSGKPWQRIIVVDTQKSTFERYERFFGSIENKEMKVSSFLKRMKIFVPKKRKIHTVTA